MSRVHALHGANARAVVLLAASALLLAACAAGRPREAPASSAGATIAALAVSLVGSPYEFGGADAAGFDCSGLVLYVHERAGLAIPRTAREQQRAARALALEELLPGDVVFFRIHSRRVDHVGIYTGAGQFVHAPRAGGTVEYADLNGDFYRRRFASAGRLWDRAARTVPPSAAPR